MIQLAAYVGASGGWSSAPPAPLSGYHFRYTAVLVSLPLCSSCVLEEKVWAVERPRSLTPPPTVLHPPSLAEEPPSTGIIRNAPVKILCRCFASQSLLQPIHFLLPPPPCPLSCAPDYGPHVLMTEVHSPLEHALRRQDRSRR